MSGPLDRYRIIELAGLGATPFCGMMLADMGAEVIVVERLEGSSDLSRQTQEILYRNRRSIGIDLKQPDGTELLMELVETADGLIEGFRPGVAERLGAGPEACWERNPGLVYGRMTGWGQSGPLSQSAGHDIDYIAVSGVLGAIGRVGERPVPPLNLVGDFGGGGLLLAFGMVCGLLEAKESGLGQVIDAAMTDGSAVLSTMVYGMAAAGLWDLHEKGVNLLDSGAPWYDTYTTSDGAYMAVGAIEPHFYSTFLGGLGLDSAELPDQHDSGRWPELRQRFTERFAEHTQAEWTEVFGGTDACVSPVLDFASAADHPHNVARETFIEVGGIIQPAPAPRFGRTTTPHPAPPPRSGADTDLLLDELGIDPETIAGLRAGGIVG